MLYERRYCIRIKMSREARLLSYFVAQGHHNYSSTMSFSFELHGWLQLEAAFVTDFQQVLHMICMNDGPWKVLYEYEVVGTLPWEFRSQPAHA